MSDNRIAGRFLKFFKGLRDSFHRRENEDQLIDESSIKILLYGSNTTTKNRIIDIIKQSPKNRLNSNQASNRTQVLVDDTTFTFYDITNDVDHELQSHNKDTLCLMFILSLNDYNIYDDASKETLLKKNLREINKILNAKINDDFLFKDAGIIFILSDIESFNIKLKQCSFESVYANYDPLKENPIDFIKYHFSLLDKLSRPIYFHNAYKNDTFCLDVVTSSVKNRLNSALMRCI